jgi:TRAP-type uncharacterized transport system substrate-binding protein
VDDLRRPGRPSATVIRAQLVLEIAAGIVGVPNQPLRQAKVLLREQGSRGWPVALFGSSTNEGIDEVVAGDAALGIINPSAALTLAYRGTGHYGKPQPIRPIAVIPSFDSYVFAVKRDTGLTCLEDIAMRRYPLRIGVRGQAEHYLHTMLDHVVNAAGFTLNDVRAWGGAVQPLGVSTPRPGRASFAALERGELDAIFDEGASGWLNAALDADMLILPVSETTIDKLEDMGYRRGVIERATYPRLPSDVPTLDFSGWPIFVHAAASDDLVTQICAALDERKSFIPWEGEGPLPVERMCRDGDDTPLDVPLHPAAQRYWQERGYLHG